MSSRPTQWVSLMLCMLAISFGALVYGELPEQVATHFNRAGEADDWSDPLTAVLMMPGIMLVTWLLLWGLPKVSPTGWRVEPFAPIWNRVQLALLAFLLFIHVSVLGHALGWWGADMGRPVLVGVGLLLVVLGNYLGKTTRNFFLGIRTPWTLASDEVWRRTHRLGGWVMVVTGVVLVGMGIFGANEIVLAVVIAVAVLAPVVYSFFVYRSVEGFKPPE
ncbi:SdpI family protein [Wenzhouxiangella sp. XN24]|uniref:SdpI family protein n=1 Tax=Wenzhouxiangella sp. XN24 TaxID=2713569 RepID=UPI0013EAE92F|nr:SdpI family protein [Wenzhouxiangella sp. XN24]NGX17587.1 DUF1648 domain-containing protein [Wenzhouxiangella sp. XN24]